MQRLLVTGTSSGIGESIARYLVKQPSIQVLGVARRSAPSALSSSDNYEHIQGDLCSKNTIDQIRETAGPSLNGVVFNASAMDAIARVADIEMESLKRLFAVNFFSIVELTQALLPALRQAHGRAIYTSTGFSHFPFPTMAAYGASKASINLFVKTLAKEEPGITALTVDPGVVDTPMLDKAIRESPKINKSKMSLSDPKVIGAAFGHILLTAKKQTSGNYYKYSDPIFD